ncbi:epsin-1 isoform b [Camelus ferus]|nr:epsin-1 isoform b [Camelus ferus]
MTSSSSWPCLSPREHDKEEQIRRGDDLRLQMAIEESKREMAGQESSSLTNLADVFTAPGPPLATDPWVGPAPMAPAVPMAATTSDPWGGPSVLPAVDLWGGPAPTPAFGDPWRTAAPVGPPVDPWGGTQMGPSPQPLERGMLLTHGGSQMPSINSTTVVGGVEKEPDEFYDFHRLHMALPTSGSSPGELDLYTRQMPTCSPVAFDMSGVGGSLDEAVRRPSPAAAPTPTPPTRKTPEPFLGPNTALVDLDSLVSQLGPTPPGAKASNTFLLSRTLAAVPSVTNHFQPTSPVMLTLNQLWLSPMPLVPGAPLTYISSPGGGPGLPPMMPLRPPVPNTNPSLL